MRIDSIDYINATEFNKQFDFGWQNTTFGDYADEGEFVWVDLSEEGLNVLYREYAEYHRDSWDNDQSAYNAYLYLNTIKFVETMRELGYTDGILVHCYDD